VREHPLVDLLIHLKGNSKFLVLIEPLWGIPYSLIGPFATLYMYALGVNDEGIGLILSIAMVMQVLCSFLGGIVADKFGRKRTTVLGDFVGWSVASAVWAISQNFWFFLIAMLLNAFEQVNQTAWTCLLIEDAEGRQIPGIYTWVTIGALVAVFFAPLSGVMIGRYSLVPVIRVLYGCFSVTMFIKAAITLRYTTETRQGRVRLSETKGTSIFRMIAEYKGLIARIFHSKATLQTLAIMVIVFITNLINSNFFGLYAGATLGVSEGWLAFFPILRAMVMIIFLFAIQRRLQRVSIKIPMQVGLVLYILCQALLIFTPKGKIWPLVLFILLEATANALVMPRKDTMVAMNVDPAERARIVALLTAFTIAFSSPFGYIAGLLSGMDRRLPFFMSATLYAAAIVVMAYHRARGTDSQTTA
jgi:MFS family permease